MHPNHILQKLLSLELPVDDYAVFGSAIMHFRGLKDLGHDIDIIARKKAWKKACSITPPVVPESKKGLVVRPFGEELEIFSDWYPGEWNIDKLIDNAEIIHGIRVVGFEDVIKWKKLMGREKDLLHIKIMEEYLANSALLL